MKKNYIKKLFPVLILAVNKDSLKFMILKKWTLSKIKHNCYETVQEKSYLSSPDAVVYLLR